MVNARQQVSYKQREALRYVDQLQYKVCRNAVRLNATNTDAHELMKYRICRQLNKEGADFLTEVFFQNGKRCDVLCLDTCTIYEVIVSETERSH